MVRNSANLHAFVVFDGAEGLRKAMETVPHKIGDAELFQQSRNKVFQLGFGGEQKFPNGDLQTVELSGTSTLQKIFFENSYVRNVL
uniref:Uncharacterized protein n=1 Tax=Ditylenchus dipsaci TaxID=166011 RepID=A0A915E3F8_9BILA